MCGHAESDPARVRQARRTAKPRRGKARHDPGRSGARSLGRGGSKGGGNGVWGRRLDDRDHWRFLAKADAAPGARGEADQPLSARQCFRSKRQGERQWGLAGRPGRDSAFWPKGRQMRRRCQHFRWQGEAGLVSHLPFPARKRREAW